MEPRHQREDSQESTQLNPVLADQCSELLTDLFAKRPLEIKPGLDRIRRALGHIEKTEGLHAPRPPVVLIGGTNGKGTTAGYLFQMLWAAGLRVGLFSSPHLCDFAERIQHSHHPVDSPYLVAALRELRKALGAEIYDELSFFEVNTLLARHVLLKLKCDVWLFEVGMGGRWDATNAFDPVLSVITSVGMDHQEYLGTSTTAIAREKSGIMRRQVPVLWGGLGESDIFAHQEVLIQAFEKGARLICGGRDFSLRLASTKAGQEPKPLLWCQSGKVVTPLPPALKTAPSFLQQNFLKAFAAYLELRDLGVAQTDPETLVGRLETAPIPPTLWARFQRICGAPQGRVPRPLILDVAHNPHGAHALKAALTHDGTVSSAGRYQGLVSILKDKDCDGILDILREAIDPVVLFACQSERSFTKQDLAARHQDLPFCTDFTAAWDCLMSEGGSQDQGATTLICGSVYALGEVLRDLGLSPLGSPAPAPAPDSDNGEVRP